MTEPRPPRLAEALLSLALPDGGFRESVLGDMHEGFLARTEDPAVGKLRASAWYWSHAVRIASGYVVRRVRRRSRFRPFGPAVRVDAVRRGSTMGEVWSDVRFALRSYRRTPGITAVALLTLALAVGANTAIFSVVNAVYLTPLQFEQPDRLVRMGLHRLDRPGQMSVHSAGGFQEWGERSSSFESMAAWGYQTVTVERGDIAERVTAAISVGSLFDVLGRTAEMGRAFTADEEGPGAEHLVVLSHAYWMRAFAGEDPVGATLRINGTPHQILGVMPADFVYPSSAAFWLTAPFDTETLAARNNFFLRTVARLRGDVTVEQAREEMAIIAADIRERLPESYSGIGIAIEPMGKWIMEGAGDRWIVLMSGVMLVLLIGCVNLANLLLSRGSSRRSEFAVRRALGAGPGRLVRQTLTESVILALAGGVLGVATGAALLNVLLAWMPGGVPRAESVGINADALAFTLVLSLGSGILFGVLPALQIRGDGIGYRLRRGASSERVRSVLVVTEVALTMVLLAAGGLTLRTFFALSAENPGIVSRDVAVFPISVPGDRPADERHSFYRQLELSLAALPGVRAVGFVSSMPVTDFTPGAWVNEPGVEHGDGNRPAAKYQVVSPGYFGTVGIELLRGRFLTRDDGIAGGRSVVISQAAADQLFPNEDPVGKQFDLGLEGDIAPLSTVVGTVGDVKLDGLDQAAPAVVYATQELMPWSEGFHVMLSLEPGSPIPTTELRQVVRGLSPEVTMLTVQRVDHLLAGSLTIQRNTMLMFGLLGLVALIMAAVGIFGVLAYLVSGRTREIGIRMAIGAHQGSVRALVLRQGMAPVVVGLVIGLVGTTMLGRFMGNMIFGVEPLDAITLLGASGLLLSVAALAIYLPARQASQVDPVRVLGAE